MKTKLTLLVLLPFIPALGLALRANFEHRQIEKARVREGAMALSQLAAAKEENFIKNTRQVLATLAEFPFLVFSTNRAVCERHFSNLCKLSPDYQTFGLMEADGMLFASAVPTNRPVNLSDRSYFQRVVETREFAIGDFQVGRLTHQPSLNFGYPVLDDQGVLKRVLFASLKLGLLSEAAAQVRLPGGATVTVIDRHGTVLGCHPEAQKWVGQSWSGVPFVRRILQQQEGIFESPGVDGVERLYAVTPISAGPSPSLFVSVGLPLSVSFAHANQILVESFAGLVLVGVLALAAARLYARRFILGPVEALVAVTDRLARGDLKARTGLREGVGELEQLARAFDAMAGNLERRQAEVEQAEAAIKRINAGLEERVQERTAQLETLNRELEAFSYSVSHDLRAPLRHIDGFVQLLQKQAASALNEKSQRYLGVISDAAKKMGRLIDDLLAFSRRGRQGMSETTVDLNRLVREIIAGMAHEIQGRSIEWSVGDLLANAVKYTRPRAPAKIEIEAEDHSPGETIFHIRDNGVGFDMQYAGNLFGVFQRLHGDSEFEGTGIGLANVRRIINRHGGRTWAEGKTGEGACFHFSLRKTAESKS